MIRPLPAHVILVWGVGLFFPFFQGAGGQNQLDASAVGFRTGYHKALTPAVGEHLGVVHEAAVLMVHFVSVGGAQCTSEDWSWQDT